MGTILQQTTTPCSSARRLSDGSKKTHQSFSLSFLSRLGIGRASATNPGTGGIWELWRLNGRFTHQDPVPFGCGVAALPRLFAGGYTSDKELKYKKRYLG